MPEKHIPSVQDKLAVILLPNKQEKPGDCGGCVQGGMWPKGVRKKNSATHLMDSRTFISQTLQAEESHREDSHSCSQAVMVL